MLFSGNAIKSAILNSQYRAAKVVNGEQLSLYFGIGRYISEHSRKNNWGTGAIERISEQLQKELPGLHGFSASNLKFMRQFYEVWSDTILTPDVNSIATAIEFQKTESVQTQLLLLKNRLLMTIRSFVEFLIQGYENPMGVATYKTAEEVRKVLPTEEELRQIMDKVDYQ